MAQNANVLLNVIRRAVEDPRIRKCTDRELLQCFRTEHDEQAFRGLVQRHGSMVLDVCRKVLGNEPDAEDAFQATFLVLVQKAGAIRKAASVGSWLYGVAYRIARHARTSTAKRQKHETGWSDQRPIEVSDDRSWGEVQQVLYDELSRISESNRAPLVLCYLEGKTQDEAATVLGVSKATVKKRLERGRALLRVRLVRRGLGPPAVLLAAAWPLATASAKPGPVLVSTTVKAATLIASGQAAAAGLVSTQVIALTKGAIKAMFMTKVKVAAVVLLAAGILGGVTGFVSRAALLAEQAGVSADDTPKQVADRNAKADDQPNAPPAPDASATRPQTEWVEKTTLKAQGKSIRSLAITPFLVAASTYKGEILRWNSKGQELPTIKVGESMVSSLAFCPTNLSLLAVATATGDKNSQVKLLDPRGEGKVLADHSPSINAVAFSPDGTTLASGGVDGGVKVWNVKTLKERVTLAWPVKPQDGGQIMSIAFSPDTRTLAAGGLGNNNDGIVRLWDTTSNLEVETLTYPGEPVMAIAYSPNARTLAVAAGITVHLWDTVKQKESASFPILRERRATGIIDSLAFSPDAKTLAVGWEGVKLYEVATLNEQADLKLPGSRGHHVAFSSDGKTLVAGGTVRGKEGYAIVKVWELQKKPADNK